MTTIAVVGAGPGLGAAVARRFGSAGFDIALVARDLSRLDQIAGQLRSEGCEARGYAASVRDPEALTAALEQAAADLGPVEVLEFSPVPQKDFLKPLLETTTADLRAAVEFSVFGPLTAVQQVLPGMREMGRGTVLFANGGSAVRPRAAVAGTSIAFAGESAYAQMLHDTLAAENIQVGQLIIPGAIRPGDENNDPARLADLLWHLHTRRDEFRVFSQ